MIEPGRLCVKIAGRDAGKKCVIVEVLDKTFVMIDGETRRRKCNVKHLEPLKETLPLKKGAAHTAVVTEFKKLGIEIKETKPKKAKEKPKQVRAEQRKKLAKAEEKKTGKAADKKGAKAPVKKAPAKADAETKLEKEVAGEGENAEQ